nr:TetR/AcrR family transcriptional regulator [uncultured Dyadobacter sp.]
MSLNKEEVLRSKILAGADKLFRQYGLSKTTMEDIAKEAGKGKSTLYYYYKSKEEIFDVIVQAEKNKFFGEVQEAVAKAATGEQKLRVFTRMRFERLKTMTNLYNIMVQEAIEAIGAGQPHTIAHYREQYDQKQANILKSILQFGIITGEFRVLTESETEMLAFVTIASLNGMEMDLIVHNKLDELLSRIDFFQDLLFNGIRK